VPDDGFVRPPSVLLLKKQSLANKGFEQPCNTRSGLRLKKNSSPERHIVPVSGGGLGGVGELDFPGIHRCCDNLGDGGYLVFGQLESLSQTLVRHLFVHHIPQAAMLVARPDTVVSIHVVDSNVRKEHR